jgi:Tol biopolymer transport system component
VTKDNRGELLEVDVDTPGLPRPSVHVSPDGKYLLNTDEIKSGIIYIVNADGSNKRRMPILFGNADWSRVTPEIVVQFFPDGKRDASDIAIINLETLELKNLTSSPTFDADPAFSPDANQIAFMSTRDGNAELYIMNRDGGNVRRMTNSPAWESFPSFSPDGTQLSYNSDRDRELNNVYIQDLDGSGRERPLPRGEWRNYTGNGFWSPDGTRIGYSSDRDETEDLYVRTAELETPREIRADANADLMAPSLSGDGKTLAFIAKVAKDRFEIRVEDRASGKISVIRSLRELTRLALTTDGKTIFFHEKIGDNTEICAVDANGANFRNLTNNGAFDAGADITPGGDRIVFVSNRRGRNVLELFVMNADGSDQQLIPDNHLVGTSFSPIWTRDGRTVVFANDRDGGGNGNFELFSIDATGGDATRIMTNSRAADQSPNLSATDGRIVFQSLSHGNTEIYLTGKNGSILRVTRNLAEDRDPIWDNQRSKIVFSSDRSGRFALYEVAP